MTPTEKEIVELSVRKNLATEGRNKLYFIWSNNYLYTHFDEFVCPFPFEFNQAMHKYKPVYLSACAKVIADSIRNKAFTHLDKKIAELEKKL